MSHSVLTTSGANDLASPGRTRRLLTMDGTGAVMESFPNRVCDPTPRTKSSLLSSPLVAASQDLEEALRAGASDKALAALRSYEDCLADPESRLHFLQIPSCFDPLQLAVMGNAADEVKKLALSVVSTLVESLEEALTVANESFLWLCGFFERNQNPTLLACTALVFSQLALHGGDDIRLLFIEHPRVLDGLSRMVPHEDAEIQAVATSALGNIAISEKCAETILALDNIIPAIVRMVGNANPRTAYDQAIRTLAHLSLDDSARQSIVKNGILKRINHHLDLNKLAVKDPQTRPVHVSTVRNAAGLLSNLAMCNTNRMPIDLAGCTQTLVDMMVCDDEVCAKHSVQCIRSLSTDERVLRTLIEDNEMIEALVRIFDGSVTGNTALLHGAMVILRQVADSNAESRDVIIETSCLDTVLHMLSGNDIGPRTQVLVVDAIISMAQHPAAVHVLKSPLTTKTLQSMTNSDDPGLRAAASYAASAIERIDEQGRTKIKIDESKFPEVFSESLSHHLAATSLNSLGELGALEHMKRDIKPSPMASACGTATASICSTATNSQTVTPTGSPPSEVSSRFGKFPGSPLRIVPGADDARDTQDAESPSPNTKKGNSSVFGSLLKSVTSGLKGNKSPRGPAK